MENTYVRADFYAETVVPRILEISGEGGIRARDIAKFLDEPIAEIQRILYQMKKTRKAVCFRKHWFSTRLGKTEPVKKRRCWCGLTLKHQSMDMQFNLEEEWVCPVHGDTLSEVGAFNPKNLFQVGTIESMQHNCTRPTAIPGQWEQDF